MWLIEHGAAPDNTDAEDGVTGLHRAINCLLSSATNPRDPAEKFKRMLFLMEQALPIRDKQGNTPLHTCGMMLRGMMPKQEFYVDCIKSLLEFVRIRNDGNFVC